MNVKMKMCETELDAFFFKFQQLWNAGIEAHLDLSSQARNAWVGLRVNLGQFPGPNCHYDRNVENASYIRRRDMKQTMHEKETKVKVSNEAKEDDNLVKNVDENFKKEDVDETIEKASTESDAE